jgi:hypothetical protein
VSLSGEEPVIARYKGRVPPTILIAHIAFMFLAILFGIRTALEALTPHEHLRPYIWTTLIIVFIGGLILGPIVQKYAFGAYWTGFPFGHDLTDNKTLIAFLGWALAAVMDLVGKGRRGFSIFAAVLMLAMYLIPHSVLGSERDYRLEEAEASVGQAPAADDAETTDASPAEPQEDAPAAPAWAEAEAPWLVDHVQLTFPDRFLKAGEAYFNPEVTWIIFQAIEQPAEGEEADTFYSMYVAPLERDAAGSITGLGEPIRLSHPGSENTCGYFDPSEAGAVLFGTTMQPPATEEAPGYQREGRDYRWQFSPEMDIVRTRVPAVLDEDIAPADSNWDDVDLAPLIEGPSYIAEGSYSSDGRYVVYTKLVDGDPNLFIYDAQRDESTPVVEATGYDGGPFFSMDGRYICYRSDRAGDDLLQIYIKEIGYDEVGRPVPGREHALTANEHVNWAPFWHPGGEMLVYASSEMGHYNYEVFAIEVAPDKPRDELAKVRVTHAPRFDGLPVFSPDGAYLMWTSQRGESGTSQIWLARVQQSQGWLDE